MKALDFVHLILRRTIGSAEAADLIIGSQALNQAMRDEDPELPEMMEPPPGSSLAVQLCYFFAWASFIHRYYEICGVISDPALRVQCRAEAYAGYLKVVGNCIPE